MRNAFDDKRGVAWFLKAPVRGTVKTRLQSRLGTHRALRLHRRLVAHSASQFSAHLDARLTAWVSGWNQHPGLATSLLGVPRATQSPGDLGDRMLGALTHTLRTSEYAILIGSDCPSVDAETLLGAFERLESGADVVLGPAADGGYYLIGMAQPWPALFRQIRWGGASVRAATLRRARVLGLCVAELEVRPDIDRPGDLEDLPSGWLEEL